MRSYNLFRRKGYTDLVCAVPEHVVVPGFLTNKHWIFAGKVEAGFGAPVGFDERTAATCARLNGFYLFQEA